MQRSCYRRSVNNSPNPVRGPNWCYSSHGSGLRFTKRISFVSFFYFLRVLVNVEYIKFTLNRCPHCSATMIPVKYVWFHTYIYMLCKNKNIRKADEKCASVGFGNSYGIASERAVDIITNCKPRVDKFILSYQVAFLSYFVITCIDTLPKSCWYMFASNN